MGLLRTRYDFIPPIVKSFKSDLTGPGFVTKGMLLSNRYKANVLYVIINTSNNAIYLSLHQAEYQDRDDHLRRY